MLIHQMTTAKSSTPLPVQLLSEREENVVRYIAGYVVYKLQKKCPAFFKSVQSSLKKPTSKLYRTTQNPGLNKLIEEVSVM